MKALFADTAYYVAFLAPRDSLHRLARSAMEMAPNPLVTTEFVLLEVANFFRKPGDRLKFAELDQTIRADPRTTLLPVTEELYQRGLALFAARPDKEWSLTDCISFEVMTELDLTDALTADAHFEQAGFRVLLKADA